MDVNAYRRIGSIYVLVCCSVAAFGAAYCLYQLMDAKPACQGFSCPDGAYSVGVILDRIVDLTSSMHCRNEERHHSGS